MTFSREEKQIWENSEVMRELERIAKAQSLETPDEAFLPIKEGQDWEDERSDEEKLMDAIEEFDKEEGLEKNKEVEDDFYSRTMDLSVCPECGEKEGSDLIGLLGHCTTCDSKKEDLDQWGSLTDEERKNEQDYLNEKENELMKDVTSNLVTGLTKLASYLGNQGKIVEASKIEDTIRDIRLTLREAKNG